MFKGKLGAQKSNPSDSFFLFQSSDGSRKIELSTASAKTARESVFQIDSRRQQDTRPTLHTSQRPFLRR